MKRIVVLSGTAALEADENFEPIAIYSKCDDHATALALAEKLCECRLEITGPWVKEHKYAATGTLRATCKVVKGVTHVS